MHIDFFFKKDERLTKDLEKRISNMGPQLPYTAHSIDTTNASYNQVLANRAQEVIDSFGRMSSTDESRP